jgi:sialate O-acetylesterase
MSLETSHVKALLSLVTLLSAGLVPSGAFAALAVNPIFRSNMVLQSGMTCPVFGTGDVGSTVTVSFLNQTLSTTVDSTGEWQVNLNSMAVNATPSTLTVSATGSASVAFTGVQVGEVWVSAGQSNMEFNLQDADGSAPDVADAANHNIRLFDMGGYQTSPSTSSWKISNATTAAAFSAVAYWHGLELEKRFHVPIGLIDASRNGSQITEWYTDDFGSSGEMLYDNRIRPIQPFAIRGVLYYQGETASDPGNYATMLPHMIAQWRSEWGLPNLPFGIVQIPGGGLVALAQFNASQAVANTWLAVTSDVSSKALHPTNKKPVGIRLSLGSRALVYGDGIEYSGPIRAVAPTSFVTGNKVVLQWTHLGGGLSTSNGAAPTNFEVADSAGRYSSATAKIVGNTVEVVSNRVSAPKRVRYQMGGYTGNLINSNLSVPIEGGASTVTKLPTATFELVFP